VVEGNRVEFASADVRVTAGDMRLGINNGQRSTGAAHVHYGAARPPRVRRRADGLG
jgi:hypothetical protein